MGDGQQPVRIRRLHHPEQRGDVPAVLQRRSPDWHVRRHSGGDPVRDRSQPGAIPVNDHRVDDAGVPSLRERSEPARQRFGRERGAHSRHEDVPPDRVADWRFVPDCRVHLPRHLDGARIRAECGAPAGVADDSPDRLAVAVDCREHPPRCESAPVGHDAESGYGHFRYRARGDSGTEVRSRRRRDRYGHSHSDQPDAAAAGDDGKGAGHVACRLLRRRLSWPTPLGGALCDCALRQRPGDGRPTICRRSHCRSPGVSWCFSQPCISWRSTGPSAPCGWPSCGHRECWQARCDVTRNTGYDMATARGRSRDIFNSPDTPAAVPAQRNHRHARGAGGRSPAGPGVAVPVRAALFRRGLRPSAGLALTPRRRCVPA